MSSTDTFGMWVRRRRRELDLTQEELAHKIGCSDSTIRRIEGDSRAPSRQLAELLAQALKIPITKRNLFLAVARGKRPANELITIFNGRTGSMPEVTTTFSSIITKPVIPMPSIPLLGRKNEMDLLIKQIRSDAVRLITITGPGGIGKTLLALHVAYDQQTYFADGVCIIELASVAAPEFIAPAILTALQVPLQGVDPLVQLLAYLQDKQLLLVLDNMEHLLSSIDIVPRLIRNKSNIKILITSREQLNIRDEWIMLLEGLSYKDDTQSEPASAITLFLHHADRRTMQKIQPPTDTGVVERICRAVGGVPLAIELAASWVTTMSWNEIAETLEHDLSLLQTSLRDVPTRHQSILTVFDHSWSLLTTEEQRVLRQLSVFRGAFSRAAAAAVTGTTLPTLRRLIEKSLVRHSGDDRYTLHELVRQYAALQRDRAQEEEAVRDAHLDYYVHLAEEADPKLLTKERYTWLNTFEADHDNFRAALEWGLGDTARTHKALRLAGALKWFWYYAGYWVEGPQWLERALNQTPSTERSSARAQALMGLGIMISYHGKYLPAREWAEESIALWRELDDKPGLAITLIGSSFIALFQADLPTAVQWLEESAALWRELEDPWGLALALTISGYIPHALGDLERARALFSESITRWRAIGDPWGLVIALNNLADIALIEGHIEEAAQLYTESASHATTNRLAAEFIPWVLFGLAQVALYQRNPALANDYLVESWPYVRRLRHARLRDSLLITLASMYIVSKQTKRGVQLLGTAVRSCTDDHALMRAADRYHYEYYLAIAREELDDTAITTALIEGQNESPIQTLEDVLGCLQDVGSANNTLLDRRVTFS